MGLKGGTMTVKEVLNLVAEYIGETDLKNCTELGGETVATEQQLEKLNLLLSCVNDVSQSLAMMYFPLKFEEKISNKTGKILFSTLKQPLLEILKIVDEHGYDTEFAIFPTYLEAKNGDLTIVYTYLPKYLSGFDNVLEIQEGKVSKRLFALGVVSRYFLLTGMYSDAEAWENMFERAVLVANRPKIAKTIKKRRWL